MEKIIFINNYHGEAMPERVFMAIKQDRLFFVFQPIFSSENRDILYLESFVRMMENSNILFPNEFIPILEKTNSIYWLDRFVLGSTIDFLSKNMDKSIGCNISAKSIFEDNWWKNIIYELSNRPDIAQHLIIEITETTQLVPVEGQKLVHQLQKLGCRIAIDDFGVGFGIKTGLDIKHPDIIKIDKIFLSGEENENKKYERFRRISNLAHNLSDCVIAEGVESHADLEMIYSNHIKWMQGFYFGMPKKFVDL